MKKVCVFLMSVLLSVLVVFPAFASDFVLVNSGENVACGSYGKWSIDCRVINLSDSPIFFCWTSDNFLVGFTSLVVDKNTLGTFWKMYDADPDGSQSLLRPGSALSSTAFGKISDSLYYVAYKQKMYGMDTNVIPVSPLTLAELIRSDLDFSGGGTDSSSVAYDSAIPVPSNLSFSATQTGGIIKPLTSVHTLKWTNALVDQYSVRVSVSGQFLRKGETTDGGLDHMGSAEGTTFNLMVASDGSDGANAGVPASDQKYSVTMSELMSMITKQYPSNELVSAVYPHEYRVQFYQYVDGVLKVGPVAKMSVTRNELGFWSGHSVTIEYPVDSDNLGDSGGLYPSGDLWTSDGQPFQDYDSEGNLAGSGISGDPDSYVPSGTGGTSVSDMLDSLINSLINIPTIVSRFFQQMSVLLTGIGDFPVLLGTLFSAFPPELISLIGLGLTVVIVLRIFGR